MSDFASVPKKTIEYVMNRDTVSIEDLALGLNISKLTAKNYLSRMAKMGLIMNIGRGLYRKGENRSSIINMPPDLSNLASILRKRFPMSNPVFWSLSMIADYSHYAIGKDLIFIETSKMLSKGIRDVISEYDYQVVLRPLARDFKEYAEKNARQVFILERKESYGLTLEEGNLVPTLERVWVDLYYFITRKKLSFSPYELGVIFGNILKRGEINFNRLIRYAGRRGLSKEIIILLHVLKERSQFGSLIPDSVLYGRPKALEALIMVTNGALQFDRYQ